MKTSLAKNTRAGNQTSVKKDSTFVKCALAGALSVGYGLAQNEPEAKKRFEHSARLFSRTWNDISEGVLQGIIDTPFAREGFIDALSRMGPLDDKTYEERRRLFIEEMKGTDDEKSSQAQANLASECADQRLFARLTMRSLGHENHPGALSLLAREHVSGKHFPRDSMLAYYWAERARRAGVEIPQDPADLRKSLDADRVEFIDSFVSIQAPPLISFES